jgi:hypothetical protein
MRIHQITSPVVCGKEFVGKWWCVEFSKDSRSDSIARYLQLDGTWGKNTAYFDTKEQLEKALSLGIKPDFTISKDEALSRDAYQAWQYSEQERMDNERWGDDARYEENSYMDSY